MSENEKKMNTSCNSSLQEKGNSMTIQSKSFTPRIGFIGMGHMGSHMALRLLSEGYTLTVYDRTPEKTHPAVQRGARAGETPRVVAATSDIILSSVADDDALEAVMRGPEGILAGARPGTIYIEMSTVSPSTIRRIALLAKEQGVRVIDAPVSGSVPQVDAGSLVIFVGGEQEAYEASKPILAVLGTKHYMGASGMGATMKLVANALLGLSLQAIAEALALGEKAGLERAQLIDVLKETSIVSPRQKTALENAGRREYPANFPLPLMFKDFGLILRLASEMAVPMPATAAAQQAYAIAQARGVKDDVAAIIAVMEELAVPTPNAAGAQAKDEDDADAIIETVEKLAGIAER
jgi:3-hydroxyisobutyrate dehydrogenase-like beta-hydroxyacid dehydrogenase